MDFFVFFLGEKDKHILFNTHNTAYSKCLLFAFNISVTDCVSFVKLINN